MNNKKLLLRFIILIAIIVAVAVVPLITVYKMLSGTYKDSYYGALPVKYDRLNSIDKEKIVIIGGSSVAFGIDSKLVEQELNMSCVNFGLYAAFGLKPMLDLSLDSIEEGDIVIISPELSSQMYSDYVGYDFLLQGCEGRSDMFFTLGTSYAGGLVSNLPTYIKEAKKIRDLGGLQVDGVYACSSVDEYGDIIYKCDYNIMDEMYSTDNLPEINKDLISSEFVTLVNKYAKKVQAKGATIYFGFCPVNELSTAEISESDKSGFLEKLEAELDLEIISSLDDHIMDAGYFYDSNFHTNSSGKILNTVLLINDLKRTFNDMTFTNIKIPNPPSAGNMDTVIASGSTGGFNYDITSNGVTITGLDEVALASDKLEVPSQIENYIVIKIDDKAFAGCSAKEITLPDTIKVLSSGIFSGAKSLTRVDLLSKSLPEVGSGLLDGASESLKLYVPENLYNNYVTNYFWARYSESIRAMND